MIYLMTQMTTVMSGAYSPIFLLIINTMPYVKGADKGVCHESPWVGEPL